MEPSSIRLNKRKKIHLDDELLPKMFYVNLYKHKQKSTPGKTNNKTDFNNNKNICKQLNLKNEINLSNNKSTKNYFQISNNTTTNVSNHKKTPKIIDIKKCIIINKNKK